MGAQKQAPRSPHPRGIAYGVELIRLVLDGHRSVESLEFDAAPFTVLFGKNNAGKTNILETIAGVVGDDGTAVPRFANHSAGAAPTQTVVRLSD